VQPAGTSVIGVCALGADEKGWNCGSGRRYEALVIGVLVRGRARVASALLFLVALAATGGASIRPL
jgi:hypothetical protein